MGMGSQYGAKYIPITEDGSHFLRQMISKLKLFQALVIKL